MTEDKQLDQHYLRGELYGLVRTDSAIFEFLQAGSLDGIWFWDLTRPEHEWMSPRFWELLGYDPKDKQHLASEWQEIINQDDLKVALDNFNKHCADPNHPYDQVVRYTHRAGHIVWVRCRGIAIRDKNGVPIRLLGAHTDISQLKRAELRLTELTSDLSRANEQLRDFNATVSHDLRRPLRSAKNSLAMLKEDHLDELPEPALARIGAAIRYLERGECIIADLVKLSQIEELDVTLELIEMTPLVSQSFDDVVSSSQRSDVQLTIGDLPPAKIERRLMRQVWQNLFDNSVKYAKSNSRPEIQVQGRMENGWSIYTLTDNGIGFDPLYSEKIFQVFHRLHHDNEYEGTGVGLAIVRRAMIRQGGQITASSTGDGSQFVLRLKAGDDTPVE